MHTLRDALDQPFEAGRAWAEAAAARLAPEIGPDTPVRQVAQGWMRLGGATDPLLVDTLFVLTDDRLGFGQIHVQTTDPNWIPLSSIVAIDLIEGVPYPLEAIEVQFAGGLAIFVGWPSGFSAAVVETLSSGGSPAGAGSVPADAPFLADVPEMPPAPVPPAFLGVDVGTPTPGGAPPGPLEPSEPGSTGAAPPGSDSPFQPDGSAAADEFFADLEHRGDVASLFSVEADDEGDTALPEVPTSEAPVPGPWDDPHIEWPEPLRGCVFLGGHPVHQRRRKNVVVVMQRGGLVIAAGAHGWSVHEPWHRIRRIDVQGADEVKFTHNHRIDHRGAALVIELADGTSLLVEVRNRRPATVRVGLAPAIAVAGAAPTTDVG